MFVYHRNIKYIPVLTCYSTDVELFETRPDEKHWNESCTSMSSLGPRILQLINIADWCTRGAMSNILVFYLFTNDAHDMG